MGGREAGLGREGVVAEGGRECPIPLLQGAQLDGAYCRGRIGLHIVHKIGRAWSLVLSGKRVQAMVQGVTLENGS